MIHIVRGEKSGKDKKGSYSIDEHDASEWLQEQLATWVPAEMRSMNLTTLEGPATRVAEVQSAVRTPSFFGERVVIVRRCGWFTSSASGSASGEPRESTGPATGPDGGGHPAADPAAPDSDEGGQTKGLTADDKAVLVAWLTDLRDEPGHLVLLCTGKPNESTQQGKALRAAIGRRVVAEHVFPGPNPFDAKDTVAWVSRRAARQGMALQAGVADLLVDRVGQDKGVLVQELAKLTAWADGQPIGKTDVLTLCYSEDDEAFPVIEAVLGKDIRAAITSYDEIARQMHPLRALATLATQWRHYVQIKELAGRRLSPGEIGGIIHAHPYKVEKDLATLRAWSTEALVSGLEAIVSLDHAFKRGQADDRSGFHLLLARLVHLGRSPARA